MLAIARAMAALCASIGHLLARCSGTLEKLSASDSRRGRKAASRAVCACVIGTQIRDVQARDRRAGWYHRSWSANFRACLPRSRPAPASSRWALAVTRCRATPVARRRPSIMMTRGSSVVPSTPGRPWATHRDPTARDFDRDLEAIQHICSAHSRYRPQTTILAKPGLSGKLTALHSQPLIHDDRACF